MGPGMQLKRSALTERLQVERGGCRAQARIQIPERRQSAMGMPTDFAPSLSAPDMLAAPELGLDGVVRKHNVRRREQGGPRRRDA